MPSTKGKLIPFTLDSRFYHDRAVNSLKRREYHKARKYFRIALDKEPENPVHYINLAGLLAELGDFEESNQLLLEVLDQVDPSLTECWFYLANNAAYMGDFEAAEEYVVEYLSKEPDGELVEDAEDLLYSLSLKLGRPPKNPIPDILPDFLQKHEKAKRLLGEGRFSQAATLLEEVIEEHPEFLPGRNNLALAYYYLGNIDLAMEKVGEVLEADPNNLYGLCNFAILTQELGNPKQKEYIVAMLKKLVPFQRDHAFKLGTTMGILGQDWIAYEIFSRILKMEEELVEDSLYHYLAVAAINIGKIDTAEKYWRILKAIQPDADLPKFYLYYIKQWRRGEIDNMQPIKYYYHLPYEEELLRMNHALEEENEIIEPSPLLLESCTWGLTYGSRQAKIQILNLLAWNTEIDSEEMLRSFLQQKEESDDLKRIALLLLQHQKAKPPYQLWYQGEWLELDQMEKQAKILEKWGQVLECCQPHLTHYTEKERRGLMLLWNLWIKDHLYHDDVIRKVEAWAAALEYVLAKFYGHAVTQSKIAEKYHVSCSTVARNAKSLIPYLEFIQDRGGESNE